MTLPRYTHTPPAAKALAIAPFPRFGAFALALAASLLSLPALADTPKPKENSELAKLYVPGPNTHKPKVEEHQAIRLTGSCVDGYIVFRAKNGAKAWPGRGLVQVTDARSGEVLHERSLRLGEGQSASFRVYQNDEQSMYYRFKVKLPDNSMTYVRGFRGRCVLPEVNVTNARR